KSSRFEELSCRTASGLKSKRKMRRPKRRSRNYLITQHRYVRRKRMENKVQYEIILYWSRDDQAFIAEVPELAGCAVDGATYQEALANVEVVIREWIETAQELGRAIPAPRGRLLYA